MSLMNRPARLQVDPETITDDDKPPQTGDTFNIWYLQWSGGDGSKNRVKSKHKVNIATDTGYTKAKGTKPICLFFARGCCYLGKDCKYYHRLPSETDMIPPTQDCFGRDKTADYRDDMDGVGSFNKRNRTLYIGALHSKTTEASLSNHFEEFGPIEYIKVLKGKNCAFITFKLESQAQFVKEAMQNQSLEENEVINLRWANEDPDPDAQQKEKKRMEEAAYQTIVNLLKDAPEESARKRAKTVPHVEEPVSDNEEMEPKILSIEQRPERIPLTFSKEILQGIAESRMPKPKVKQTLSCLVGSYSSDDEC